MTTQGPTLKIRGLQSDKVWDYENGYHWFSGIERMGKVLNHYEIYKMATSLPGHIVECGVYKAASLIRWATFRSLLESDHSRRIIAFDAFGKFPDEGVQTTSDASFIKRFEDAGGDGLSVSETRGILDLKHITNVDFEEGNVLETIPAWLETTPEARICLLHLDMDVYEPTKAALDLLWDRIVRGGVVVIDDNNAVGGATNAVDEFLQNKNIKLRKLGLSHVPCYFVKD